MKVCDELELDKARNIGITIILHKDWMFVAPLTCPYMNMENGMSLFVDPFAYGGILNIHIKEHDWPQAAGIEIPKDSVLEIFKKSCDSNFIPREPSVHEDLEGEGDGDVENHDEAPKEGEGEGNKEDDEEEEE